ncbi:hypothetical protein K501DRAFT_287357 [Backusella circina FSU 941]|nr:hypothetical protein K501DRAFT_287354 [Backusella circina FSU 941]KAI8879509.1 hypothetical protein K501DRAFT_287357 [Backusella circina FSU 941]
MLNNHQVISHQKVKRPAVLDIANLLCSKTSTTTTATTTTSPTSSISSSSISSMNESPFLSPSYSSSPGSVSSFTSYPFPSQTTTATPYLWEDVKKQNDAMMMVHTPPMSSVASFDEEHDDLLLDDEDDDLHPIKTKRRRANVKQLEVLNRVFERTFFPSTQMRAELGRQLSMSPRTVQIWFQNRRQAMRTKERHRLIRLRNESK